MPHTIFLVPGYGAQGATAADVVGCFDARGYGAIVNASRSILLAFRTPTYAHMAYAAAARAATLPDDRMTCTRRWSIRPESRQKCGIMQEYRLPAGFPLPLGEGCITGRMT